MSTVCSRDLVIPMDHFDTLDDIIELAQLAETNGYGFVSMGETTGRNVPLVLGLLAEHTESIGLTEDVLSPFSRTPSTLGQTAVTLQEISGGRFRLRLGASSPALAEQWHGVPFDRPLRRVREAIEIIRQVQSGDRLNYDGDCYTPNGLALDCPPPETPVPIDVAALGPKSTEMTGRFADGWVPQLVPYSGFIERLEDLRRGADLGGRDIDDIRVSYMTRCCAIDDREKARQYARSQVAFMVALYGPYYRESIANAGYEDITSTVRKQWLDGNREAAMEAVTDDLLDNLVIAGTPDEAREQLARYEAIEEVDSVQLAFFASMNDAERKQTVEELAPA